MRRAPSRHRAWPAAGRPAVGETSHKRWRGTRTSAIGSKRVARLSRNGCSL